MSLVAEVRALNKKASNIQKRLGKEREPYNSTLNALGKTIEQLQRTEGQMLKEIQGAANGVEESLGQPILTKRRRTPSSAVSSR